MTVLLRKLGIIALACAAPLGAAQSDQQQAHVDVRLHLALPARDKKAAPPAVAWLKPLERDATLQFLPHKTYTLAQKNRTFLPHLLVVPVGSHVLFPNEDPFYHNVFSLFDGKRFDLGLYEAGSTRTVTFSREGVSYIFCNIHPEMSAVVIALSTPLYATADATGAFTIPNVPEGDYQLHAWVEGVSQTTLDHLTRHIHVRSGKGDLGALQIPAVPSSTAGHLNKFGQPYGKDSKDIY